MRVIIRGVFIVRNEPHAQYPTIFVPTAQLHTEDIILELEDTADGGGRTGGAERCRVARGRGHERHVGRALRAAREE